MPRHKNVRKFAPVDPTKEFLGDHWDENVS
jgi:hypothetical protein